MCRVLNKCNNQKPFVGYKVVIKVGKRYYSYYSGIQYKKGLIPIITQNNKCYKNKKRFLIMN